MAVHIVWMIETLYKHLTDRCESLTDDNTKKLMQRYYNGDIGDSEQQSKLTCFLHGVWQPA